MNKYFAFHGTDHKVGTTMIAQSVAEIIADEKKHIKVLLLTLNGRKNTDYIKENVETIDNYRNQIESKMIVAREFMSSTRTNNNLHVLAGVIKEDEERYYFPNSVEYLVESVEEEFDIIISDTGSELDNGLAYGGLTLSDNNFMVITQQESSISRFELLRERYDKAGINFNRYIVNKFDDKDPYTIQYILKRLNISKDTIFKVKQVDYSRQAEMEYKTLIDFKDENYRNNIINIANYILEKIGEPQIDIGKKNKWKNFI